MDAFEKATSAVPTERKCIQGPAGRFTNYPVGDCFFGVPPSPLYGREPLETLPASTTRFHFYLGSDALDLIAAFTKSKFAAAVTHLAIGDCSYAADCDYEYAAKDSSYADGSWLDFTEVVNVLGGGHFPSLRSLQLGVCRLFHNQGCAYGRLGNAQDCSFALHDALLEAGHTELAKHFKEKDHPKGCWAMDTILGKK